jgi:hypothetical protein
MSKDTVKSLKKQNDELKLQTDSRPGRRIWNTLPTESRDLTNKDFGKILHRKLLYILSKEDDFINQTDLLKEIDKCPE